MIFRYQQYITVSETGLVVVVPPELALDKACLLPCGGLTAYNAVKAALPTVQEFLESTGQLTRIYSKFYILGYFIVYQSPSKAL